MADMTDYVTELVLDDTVYDTIFQYRKWNSGVAECWGTTSELTRTGNTAWGSGTHAIYYDSSLIGGDAYPTGLFTTTPVCRMTWVHTDNDSWINIHRDGTKNNAPTAYVYRATQNVASKGYIHYYAVGRWK